MPDLLVSKNIQYLIYLLYGVNFLIVYWAWKGKPEKQIFRQFTWKAWLVYMIPFNDRWKQFIKADDMSLFEEYFFRCNITASCFIWTKLFIIVFVFCFVLDKMGYM